MTRDMFVAGILVPFGPLEMPMAICTWYKSLQDAIEAQLEVGDGDLALPWEIQSLSNLVETGKAVDLPRGMDQLSLSMKGLASFTYALGENEEELEVSEGSIHQNLYDEMNVLVGSNFMRSEMGSNLWKFSGAVRTQFVYTASDSGLRMLRVLEGNGKWLDGVLVQQKVATKTKHQENSVHVETGWVVPVRVFGERGRAPGHESQGGGYVVDLYVGGVFIPFKESEPERGVRLLGFQLKNVDAALTQSLMSDSVEGGSNSLIGKWEMHKSSNLDQPGVN